MRASHCVAALLLLLAPTVATAQRRTTLDYGLAIGSTLLIAADWSQTEQYAQQHAGEGNPLLGEHPSEGTVNTYFTLATVANASALLLPRTPRRIWYVTVAALEAWTVAHNMSMGWRIRF